MKKIMITMLICLAFQAAHSQKFITKNGHIRFFSDAPLEKIEAHNRQVNAALDAATGDFVFKVLMKSFEFEKALMQEHFNENYVHSDKYPSATLKAKVTNIKEVNFSKDGSYPVVVEGNLTMHGVTKPVKADGTFVVKQGKLSGNSRFTIKLSDYNIEIPGAVIRNISNTVEIMVNVDLVKAS